MEALDLIRPQKKTNINQTKNEQDHVYSTLKRLLTKTLIYFGKNKNFLTFKLVLFHFKPTNTDS